MTIDPFTERPVSEQSDLTEAADAKRMTTPPNREALRALADKATPGPWSHNPAATRHEPVWRVEYRARGMNKGASFVIANMQGTEGNDVANAAFIAAARSAIPELLDALDAQHAEWLQAEDFWKGVNDGLRAQLQEATAQRDAALARAEKAEAELADALDKWQRTHFDYDVVSEECDGLKAALRKARDIGVFLADELGKCGFADMADHRADVLDDLVREHCDDPSPTSHAPREGGGDE